MERKLASIQEIKSLEPVYVRETMEEASSIEMATILGWSVVVRKGEFKQGDMCIFFEIDSILPETEWSEFLRSKHFHIKTMKLGSMRFRYVDAPIVSQGFAQPVTILSAKQIGTILTTPINERIGYDVTELLGVTKYEVAIPSMGGQTKGNFHPLIVKTDEIRIQSAPVMLDELFGKPYYITKKMDGSSLTAVTDKDGFHVYSRNLEVSEESTFYQTAFLNGVVSACNENLNIAIQGELCGPAIQKNRIGLKDYHIYVFNVFDIITQRYYNYQEMEDFCLENHLEMAPLLILGDNFTAKLSDLDRLSRGEYPSGHPQEGIVIRPQTETYSRYGSNNRLSFKFINPDFLLKIGE